MARWYVISQKMASHLPPSSSVISLDHPGRELPNRTPLPEKVRRCVEALSRNLPVDEIWLFGSCSRETASPESDIDLFAVFPDDHGIADPTLAAVRAISRERAKLRADVLILSRSDWEKEKARPFGIYRGHPRRWESDL